MLNINIVCVGKIKENYLKDAIAEYSKRLSKYCILNFIEIQDEKLPLVDEVFDLDKKVREVQVKVDT